MAGHSRWAQIKRKKAAADAKRGQLFSKLSRAISLAAKENPDPQTNQRLRAAIEAARAVDMPNDNIGRALRRATESGTDLHEILLEFLGPAGSAILVSAITDNPNRTRGELHALAQQYGARPTGEGSLLWLFRRAGVIRYEISEEQHADELALRAIDSGATDIVRESEVVTVLTPPETVEKIRAALEPGNPPPLSSGVEFVPTTPTRYTPENTQKIFGLIEALQDDADVQDVFTNAIE